MTPHILIVLEGGLIQEVRLISGPKEWHTTVIDYDTDGVDDKELCRCRDYGADDDHIHHDWTDSRTDAQAETALQQSLSAALGWLKGKQ